jgi:glutamate--cysteine ligase
VLVAIHEHGNSFERFALHQSKQHAADFRSRPPSAKETAHFTQLAKNSLDEQAEMEREQSGDFDQFITDYRSRTPKQLCD